MDPSQHIEEFVLDWKVRGLSTRTIDEYQRYLRLLLTEGCQFDLAHVRKWLDAIESQSARRQASRAIRCFGKYLEARDLIDTSWWRSVPLPIERPVPQVTVTLEQVAIARRRCLTPRDRALIEMLWSTGLRRSEIANVRIEDFQNEFASLIVREAKGGHSRRVPLSPDAVAALSHFLGCRRAGSLFGLTSTGVAAVLRRLELPPTHAWRRGWAVDSLRRGVSEVSVRTAAGWKTGAMVARYTAALSEELALAEFERIWRDI